MVEYGKLFKCEDCGSIVEVLVDAHEEKACCDSSKNIIEPQTEGDKLLNMFRLYQLMGMKLQLLLVKFNIRWTMTISSNLLN